MLDAVEVAIGFVVRAESFSVRVEAFGELVDGGESCGGIGLWDEDSGVVAFDACADAFAGAGDDGDFEGGGFGEGSAAALEVFVGGPGDVEGFEEGVVFGLVGDAWGEGIEVDGLDFAVADAGGDGFEPGEFIGIEGGADEVAGEDEVEREVLAVCFEGGAHEGEDALAFFEADDAGDFPGQGFFADRSNKIRFGGREEGLGDIGVGDDGFSGVVGDGGVEAFVEDADFAARGGAHEGVAFGEEAEAVEGGWFFGEVVVAEVESAPWDSDGDFGDGWDGEEAEVGVEVGEEDEVGLPAGFC